MAPKKSKGRGRKGKKKTPLTDEQKRKQAEQKALAEKEKLARRQDLTKAFLTLKKEKEYQLIKLNEKKILDLWRPLLRKQKIAELLQDYQLMQHAFERVFNRKTNIIQEVEKTLQKTEGEYDHAVDMHMYNIDKMMEFYRSRVKEIREMFLDARNSLLDRMNEEKRRISQHHKTSLKQITDKMDATKKRFEELDAESKVELLMREENRRNNDMQEIHLFKTQMEAKMNQYWQVIQNRIINIEQVTAEKRKEFIKLKERDLKLSALIDTQFGRHAVLKTGIEQLNKRTALFQKTYNNYIEDLKEKKIECRGIYNELMTRRRLLNDLTSKRIGLLAITSGDIIEKMDIMLVKRDKVLKATERCRRREQLQEKVDPFLKRFNILPFVEEEDTAGLSEYTRKSIDLTNSAAGTQHFRVHGAIHNFDCNCEICMCEIAGEGGTKLSAPINVLINEYSLLERFWVRFNKVSLDKAALRVRRNHLLSDNFNLKITLRNYMGGMNPPSLNAGKFAEQIMEESKNDVWRIMRIINAEKERKDRSRKIGGLRMH